MNGQHHAPGNFLAGKKLWHPIEQVAGWAPEPVLTFRRTRKSLVPAVQPVALSQKRLYIYIYIYICVCARVCTHTTRHNFCCGKTKSITYSECVCSLLYSTQCACAVLYCHLWSVQMLHIFPHYSTQHDFGENVTEHNMCVLISATTFYLKHLILRRNQ